MLSIGPYRLHSRSRFTGFATSSDLIADARRVHRPTAIGPAIASVLPRPIAAVLQTANYLTFDQGAPTFPSIDICPAPVAGGSAPAACRIRRNFDQPSAASLVSASTWPDNAARIRSSL